MSSLFQKFLIIKKTHINNYINMCLNIWQEQKELNPHQRFWRPLFYH